MSLRAIVRAVVMSAAALGLSGCWNYNVVDAPETPATFPEPAPPEPGQSVVFAADERVFAAGAQARFELLRPGDVVRVVLAGDASLTGSYSVPPSGRLVLPLLGSFEAAGRRCEELSGELEARAKAYYSEPLFHLAVERTAARFAFVFGAFERPGAVEVEAGDSLLTVIAKAGGVARRENALRQSLGLPRSLRLQRGGEGMATIDLRALLSGQSPEANLSIAPGDVITVEQDDSPTVTVLGQVGRPGLLGLTPGMDVVQALALAGGVNEDADDDEIRVVRRWWTDSPEHYQIDLDDLERGAMSPGLMLEDRDIVYVRRSNLATINYYLRQITGPLTAAGQAGVAPAAGGAAGP